jgi:mRNA interferase HigB
MRIITRRRLESFGRRHADARGVLADWADAIRAARWRNLAQTRAVFPHADEVRAASGRRVTVFNVRGNHYRLITAIHYDRQRVYVMKFLTHAEYDRNTWKDDL